MAFIIVINTLNRLDEACQYIKLVVILFCRKEIYMLIQKINTFNTQRFQAKSAVNQQPKSYMSNVRSNSMGDTVSFGINLEPKLLSKEVNVLLGKAINKIETEQKTILASLNAPIKALAQKTDLTNLNISEFKAKDLENIGLIKRMADGTVINFNKILSTVTNKEELLIKINKEDSHNVIKIQENCLEQIKSNKKGVELNNAFYNDQTTEKQMTMLRYGSNRVSESITNPETSKGIQIMNSDLETALTNLLG